MKSKPKKSLFFDYDGTLVDSLESTAQIHREVLRQLGKDIVVTSDLIRAHWSAGWQKLYTDVYGMTREETMLSTPVYRNLAREHCRVTTLFDGIEGVLRKLGKTHSLYVISANYSEVILGGLAANKITSHFSGVYGQDSLYGIHKNDPRFYLIPVDELGLEKEDITVIGDSVGEIEAAKKAGLKVIGCSWGWQDRDALIDAKPDFIADDPRELLDIVQEP